MATTNSTRPVYEAMIHAKASAWNPNAGAVVSVIKTADCKTLVINETTEHSYRVSERALLLESLLKTIEAINCSDSTLKLYTEEGYIRQVIANWRTWKANNWMTKNWTDPYGRVTPAHAIHNKSTIEKIGELIDSNKIFISVDVKPVSNKVRAMAEDTMGKSESDPFGDAVDDYYADLLAEKYDVPQVPDLPWEE